MLTPNERLEVRNEPVEQSIDQDVSDETDDDFVHTAFGFTGLFFVAAGGEVLDANDSDAEDTENANANSHDVDDEVEDAKNAIFVTTAT